MLINARGKACLYIIVFWFKEAQIQLIAILLSQLYNFIELGRMDILNKGLLDFESLPQFSGFDQTFIWHLSCIEQQSFSNLS